MHQEVEQAENRPEPLGLLQTAQSTSLYVTKMLAQRASIFKDNNRKKEVNVEVNNQN